MEINEIIEGGFAHIMFTKITENEKHSIEYDKSTTDEDYEGNTLLSESGLYEFHEEYHDAVVCYFKRVA